MVVEMESGGEIGTANVGSDDGVTEKSVGVVEMVVEGSGA